MYREGERGEWVCRLCPNMITPQENYDGMCEKCWSVWVISQDGIAETLL